MHGSKGFYKSIENKYYSSTCFGLAAIFRNNKTYQKRVTNGYNM